MGGTALTRCAASKVFAWELGGSRRELHGHGLTIVGATSGTPMPIAQ